MIVTYMKVKYIGKYLKYHLFYRWYWYLKKMYIVFKMSYKYKTEKCQFCGLYLHRFKGYHGAIDINKNISGKEKETVYLCNLCYHVARKTKWG